MKYKVLGTNDIQKFVQVMMRCQIPQSMAFGEGIDESIIEEVNKLAVKRKIAILTLPNGLLEGEDQGRKFIFIPKDKDANGPFGVFVPITVGDSVENHKHFIETPVLPDMHHMNGMFPKNPADNEIHREMKLTEGPGSKPKVKQEGRPKRKGDKDIGKKDEERLGFLLKNTDSVEEFLKCIDEEEKK